MTCWRNGSEQRAPLYNLQCSPQSPLVGPGLGPDLPGFRGLIAARALLFMSFKHHGGTYPCALVTWFSPIGDEPCPDVGMWMVEPDVDNRGQRVMDVIHIDTILRAAHLIGIYGHHSVPRHFKYSDSLDSFKAFYINKYADHHAHEIAF
ncbi:hypothetical protein B0H10DRAFT_2385897 [Mycena sp. CBHHK59/15]|nr:hypothetical protein B0H10DRAFT_2385897 [Mycena sp. CBHHK59/15]